MAGKGCRYRPVNQKKYGENYDKIFGKQNPKLEKTEKGKEIKEIPSENK